MDPRLAGQSSPLLGFSRRPQRARHQALSGGRWRAESGVGRLLETGGLAASMRVGVQEGPRFPGAWVMGGTNCSPQFLPVREDPHSRDGVRQTRLLEHVGGRLAADKREGRCRWMLFHPNATGPAPLPFPRL